MKRVLHWLLDYWWIPALVVAGVGVSLFGRRAAQSVLGADIDEKLAQELDAIEAKREIREMQARFGHKIALARVKEKYRREFAQLDEAERTRAKNLEANPQQLAKAMARLARKRQCGESER